MSQKGFVLVNEAWAATSRDRPGLNNTRCIHNIQNKRRAIIHNHAADILPQHICAGAGVMSETALTDLDILSITFSRHTPTQLPLLCVVTRKLWHAVGEHRSQRSVESLSGANRYLQGAFAVPRDGAAALRLPGRLRYGGISVVDHTRRKSRPPISLSYGHFLLPSRFSHSPWPDSIIPAALSPPLISIDPSRSRSAGPLLPPLLKQALTPRTHSLLTLFHFYLAVASARLAQFRLSSYLPFVLLHSQTMPALIQINFETHLLSLFRPSICPKPARSYWKWMFSKSRIDLRAPGSRTSFLSCDISFPNTANALSLASNDTRPCFCSLQLLFVIFLCAFSQLITTQYRWCHQHMFCVCCETIAQEEKSFNEIRQSQTVEQVLGGHVRCERHFAVWSLLLQSWQLKDPEIHTGWSGGWVELRCWDMEATAQPRLTASRWSHPTHTFDISSKNFFDFFLMQAIIFCANDGRGSFIPFWSTWTSQLSNTVCAENTTLPKTSTAF